MDRDRDRDRRPGERYAPTSASTYRPARSPPARDSYRAPRSPPRRPPPADTYIPSSSRAPRPRSRSPGYRRRSRSPRGGYMRQETDTWRARPRSPPRRDYSPRRDFSPRRDDYRRDTRARSPARDYTDPVYDRRSPPRPVRERSPPPLKRSRDVSPVGSRGRSPPPAKRERLASPPPRIGRYDEPRLRAYSPPRRAYSPPRDRSYRPRSRSPPRREDRAGLYAVDTWRRRSPSPPRPAYDAGVRSGRESVASSRRSSPPVHPSRLGLVPEERPPVEAYSPRPRSPVPYRARSAERERSPPRRREPPPIPVREREFTNGGVAPPSGPRNNDVPFSRAPPTGPSGGNRNFSYPAMSPPSGPASAVMPMSAHSRPNNPILSAPSRPRGGGGRGGFGARDYPPYEPTPMGPRRNTGPWTPRGGGPTGPGGYHGGPPSGPRGGMGGPPPFRGSSNSTSTTYPRTQRFNNPAAMAQGLQAQQSVASSTNHLADVPPIVPGGQRQKDLMDTSRLQKLEDEARKLREMIAEKEAVGRRGRRDWERMERESETASLRAELADEHLRSLNGEGEMGGAAF